MNQAQPIYLSKLMPAIDQLLIDVLESLSLKDWAAQSLAPQWTVKDVAVHLLDGNLRAISMLRDGYVGEEPGDIQSYQDLLAFLDRLNADWIQAMKRLSPAVIIDLLKQSGKEYCDFIQTLDPHAIATFSVAWAGEQESKNWFHIAREYTEKWHHQQQIRYAVGQDHMLLTDEWYKPYLDTSVRGLPHHYREVKGERGDLIHFVFRGETDKFWFLSYQNKQWNLLTASSDQPNATVIIPDEYAWRIFTKGIKRELAISHSEITGNQELGKHIFNMIAIMG